MVITHDCDCVTDEESEPLLEVMIGTEIGKADGNFSYAKSTRKLHLKLSGCDKSIELIARTRASIPKSAVADIEPAGGWTITDEEKRILRRWLGARYDRPSFPNELVHRIRPVQSTFREAAKADGADIIGIFVDFEPKYELPHDGAEPYEFIIEVVYPSTKPEADAAAARIAECLRRRFEEIYKIMETDAGLQWTGIELTRCSVTTDITFTYDDALSFYVYRLDEFSLRDSPQGELPR